MSLAEIEKAVDALSPEDLAKLAAYIARHDKLAWIKKSSAIFPPTQTRGLPQKNRCSNRSRQFHAVAVTSRALPSFWKCYHALPRHIQNRL
jgi:hypothetical protein